MVQAKKPAPDIYTWVLEQMGLSGADSLALEDSGNGLRPSLAAGFTTLVTLNGYTAKHDFSGAIAVVGDLGEPDAPMRVTRGPCESRPMVDVALLSALHTPEAKAACAGFGPDGPSPGRRPIGPPRRRGPSFPGRTRKPVVGSRV
jgi:hypothetical protein